MYSEPFAPVTSTRRPSASGSGSSPRMPSTVDIAASLTARIRSVGVVVSESMAMINNMVVGEILGTHCTRTGTFLAHGHTEMRPGSADWGT